MSNYFGSDLNKFIHDNCRKDMIVNNIDLIMLKRIKNKYILRIIESKHMNEKPMVDSQKQVHLTLSKVLKQNCDQEIVCEHYIVKGSDPYEKVYLYNFMNNKTTTLNRQELISFLNFE